MAEIVRLMPTPIPAIHPVPEYRADAGLKARYEDMKTVFQVPWMGVVTMAYAHYRHFYDALWEGLRPLCIGTPFVDAFRDLRAMTEAQIAALDPPPIADRLASAGYAPRELDDIRAVIEVFSHGNFPYLMLATIVRMLIEGVAVAADGDTPKFDGRHAPAVSVPFVLMEAHHAAPETRQIYDDVKQTLKLPFINTDYRALARWPSYFAMAWDDLRTVAGTPAHEAICQAVHDRAVELARALPNPGRAEPGTLRAAAQEDGDLAEVTEMCRLFQWLLPGLVTNVAFLRHQLATG